MSNNRIALIGFVRGRRRQASKRSSPAMTSSLPDTAPWPVDNLARRDEPPRQIRWNCRWPSNIRRPTRSWRRRRRGCAQRSPLRHGKPRLVDQLLAQRVAASWENWLSKRELPRLPRVEPALVRRRHRRVVIPGLQQHHRLLPKIRCGIIFSVIIRGALVLQDTRNLRLRIESLSRDHAGISGRHQHGHCRLRASLTVPRAGCIRSKPPPN